MELQECFELGLEVHILDGVATRKPRHVTSEPKEVGHLLTSTSLLFQALAAAPGTTTQIWKFSRLSFPSFKNINDELGGGENRFRDVAEPE